LPVIPKAHEVSQVVVFVSQGFTLFFPLPLPAPVSQFHFLFLKPSMTCSTASSGCQTSMRGPAKLMTFRMPSRMEGLKQWAAHLPQVGLFSP